MKNINKLILFLFLDSPTLIHSHNPTLSRELQSMFWTRLIIYIRFKLLCTHENAHDSLRKLANKFSQHFITLLLS